MHRKPSTLGAVLVGVLLVVGQWFGVGAASANHDKCVNEPFVAGGDDLSVNVGPGVLLVGIDKGDQAEGVPDPTAEMIVCAQSDVLDQDLTFRVDRGDVPSVQESTGCILAVLDNCLVTGKRVVFDDGDPTQFVRIQSDGTNVATASVPVHCIALPSRPECP